MKKKHHKLIITHLYPEHMNIYGDMGNMIVLVKRCEWRGIKVDVKNVNLKESLPRDTDIYFMGGGQDDDQIKVFQDLLKKKRKLTNHVEKGVVFLGICGAFQLLGKYFLTGKGKLIKGIGLLDIETKASDTRVKSRCIGNIADKLNREVFSSKNMPLDTLVGFENHSGQTFLGNGVQPLGHVIRGFGNNMKDDTEGCVYKNLIGTYMHGSFLPKNPHIADWLISQALKRKQGRSIRLKQLDDKEEIEAHKFILENLR